jgi:ketosteroid isomerase-like protein
LCAVVFFDPDDIDAAIAELDRRYLAAEDPHRLRLENACTRAQDRYVLAFNSQDWEGVVASLAEDVRTSDRRLGMQNDIRGRDEALKQYGMWTTDAAGAVLSQSVLAIRGDRLGLFSHTYVTGGPTYEIEFLTVVEVDEDGQRTNVVYFDHEDLDGAFAELDLRYLARNEAKEADRLWLAVLNAYNARDWEGLRSLMSEDCIYFDHQPAGRGVVDSTDEWIENIRTLIELIPDLRGVARADLRESEGLTLVWAWFYGIDGNGSRIEYEFLFMFAFSGGRVTRLEAFPPEQLNGALALFHELAVQG